jgi:predicted nucleic acid-binding Zn ribbon protein
MEKRLCPVCQDEIKGRQDKKFCSPNCKSSHQYEKRREEEDFFFEVEAQLKTNRKLLKRYNLRGKTILRREELLQEGFNPNFFTHYWKTTKGEVYLFVYDFGFLAITDQQKKKYLIVKWQDYMKKSIAST